MKTYTEVLMLRAMGNDPLTVVFKCGRGCPYGTEEVVRVNAYIGS